MKSNQERSNESLPPKKREIPVSNFPPAGVPTAERESLGSTKHQLDGAPYKPLLCPTSGSVSTFSPIQYAQLTPSIQFIGSSYPNYGSPAPPSLRPPPPPDAYGKSEPLVPSRHPPHLHSPLSQVVLQYAEGSVVKKEDGRLRQVLNGELDKGQRYQMPPVVGKRETSQRHQYDTSGLRTLLVPSAHVSTRIERNERTSPSQCRPLPRSASSSVASQTFSAPTSCAEPKPLQTVIQSTHSAPDPLFYPTTAQPPIIGYIAGQSQAVSYHPGLPQNLLIPGGQQVLIPVGHGVGLDLTGGAQQVAVSPCQPFVAAETASQDPSGAAGQAQIHLPLVPASPPVAAIPALPPYFAKGSIIQLADGELKRVEELKTEDFVQSAEISRELKIDSSTVERIEGSQLADYAVVQFAVGEQRTQVSLEVLLEYPFFVFGQGWSSCCPDRTTRLLELPCSKLSVGDVCVSLSLRNPRNGSLKKSPALDAAWPAAGLSLKTPKDAEWGNGAQGAPPKHKGKAATNPSQTEAGGNLRPARRKRRWSAPESRKVDKADDDSPLTLPRLSFIPQEVKISIEGKSNIGK